MKSSMSDTDISVIRLFLLSMRFLYEEMLAFITPTIKMTIPAIIISMAEGLPLSTCLFETASAVGTVGLTLGITSQLGIISQIVLMTLMFLGRVGGLTLIFAALSGTNKKHSKLPQEKITVG